MNLILMSVADRLKIIVVHSSPKLSSEHVISVKPLYTLRDSNVGNGGARGYTRNNYIVLRVYLYEAFTRLKSLLGPIKPVSRFLGAA